MFTVHVGGRSEAEQFLRRVASAGGGQFMQDTGGSITVTMPAVRGTMRGRTARAPAARRAQVRNLAAGRPWNKDDGPDPRKGLVVDPETGEVREREMTAPSREEGRLSDPETGEILERESGRRRDRGRRSPAAAAGGRTRGGDME